MQPVRIQISSEKGIKRKDKRRFQAYGLYKAHAGQYEGWADNERMLKKIQKICHDNRYRFAIQNEYGIRSGSYRSTYFKDHPADAKNRYRCVYCGKMIPADKITIDHLYPINKAKQNIRLQEKMKKTGISSVNCKENLVAACFSCNRRKSDKMGIWIFRGKIGQSEGLWKVRKFITALIILAVLLCIPLVLQELGLIHIF